MLARLAQIVMLMPVSTVACERGFSALTRIKTKLRNALKGRNLEACIMFSVDGRSVHELAGTGFFKDAVTLWFEVGTRRVSA